MKLSMGNGNSFLHLLDKALLEFDSFSVVWRNELDYNSNALEFDRKLEPFLLSECETSQWPGTRLVDAFALVKKYSVSEDTINVLRCVSSTFDLLAPDFPEDLAFYSDGKVVYASVAHERLEWDHDSFDDEHTG